MISDSNNYLLGAIYSRQDVQNFDSGERQNPIASLTTAFGERAQAFSIQLSC